MAQEIADSTLLDTWGSSGAKIEPDISKIIEGWQLGEQPPHEYMNWLQNTFGSKLNHILKNGVASWNNETEYLAGSSVQHNSNVWLCKSTNTNSEPTDVNSNWKRIITVESLTTVLGGYVKNSEDETIDGIKTFSSSPIVPTPTTGTQAANKDYVDSVAALPDASTTVKGKVELATTAEAQAGTDDLKAITSLKLRDALNATGTAPIYACRAWVNFNGTGTVAIRASGNVSSITDNGTGNYTINFTTAMTDANYSAVGSASSASGVADGTAANAGTFELGVSFNLSSLKVSSFSYNNVAADRAYMCVSLFR
jgi:hypothetical protein